MSEFLKGSYDLRLVCLSVLIAVLAAYAALDLAGRLTTTRGKVRMAWLSGGAIALGSGIWAMHYVGMEAFRLPIPVLYDWPTVLLSLLAAILASAVALFTVSRPRVDLWKIVYGGFSVGGGIASMHYIGMDAMRLRAMCVYSTPLVVLSVAVAIVISFAALELSFSLRDRPHVWGWRKPIAAVLMGSAIAGMHYIGMAAVDFAPTASVQGSLAYAVGVSNLAVVCIAVVVITLLFVVFFSASLNRKFSLQTRRLEESQLLLQTVFENMSEGIVVMDRNRDILLTNKVGNKLLSLQELDRAYTSVQTQFEAFSADGNHLPPDQWPSSRALRGDFVKDYQILYRHRVTGATGAREMSTAPMPNRTGDDFQVIVTLRDTTEKWLADEARNRLALIVESSDDAIIGKDTFGVITSWNRGAEKVFGYSASEMVGQSIKLLLPPGRENEEDEILARVLRGETVDHFETTRKTKSAKIIHVSLTISPIKDARGKVVGASKIARDITERKMLESQLHQSQKLEAVGQLTGGIAHDFNNLLGVMLGNLDLLERAVSGQPVLLKRVNTAQDAATRGAHLIRRLLTFASREELRAAPTQLSHSIQDVLELASRTLGPDIKVTTDFELGMPPVLVDSSQLENVILNLIVNARDAMPQGGSISIVTRTSYLDEAYPSVQTADLKPGHFARVSVSDTGCGMTPETAARAFEPFFTTKPRSKGTGLGLAMVYGFVKQSGGSIRIYSEFGFGTTISFYLPFAEPGALPAKPVPVAQPSTHAGQKVLVVDDEEDLLEVAATYLNEAGYRALQASNGAEAIEIIAQQPDIGLLITDIIMGGGLNGVGLVQRAREISPGIRFLYCSGFPSDALAEKNVSLEEGQLLNKPYQREEFHAAVRQAMSQG